MKTNAIQVIRGAVVPEPIWPKFTERATQVGVIELALSKLEYERALAAHIPSDTPVESRSVPDLQALHLDFAAYASGGNGGLVLVRRQGWRVGRNGNIRVTGRYVPLAGNQQRLPRLIVELLQRHDQRKTLVFCVPAANGTGKCLLTVGLQETTYPQRLYDDVLADAMSEPCKPGNVVVVRRTPPGFGSYVCIKNDGDKVLLQRLRTGKRGQILGATAWCAWVDSRSCDIIATDDRVAVSDLPKSIFILGKKSDTIHAEP